MISLKNVTKEYLINDTAVITPIRDVSLEVQRGEFLMIIGRSGSGKTTLLNLCAGLVTPTSGQVFIDGKDIQHLSDFEISALRRNKIGFIFQFQSMMPSFTVIENVAIPAVTDGRLKDPYQRAADLLDMVGIKDKMHVFPKQLSAGELRRVAIARALINQPEIILADEPTADLDENTEQEIVSLLRRINNSGVTLVMITHNLELVPFSSRALKVENSTLQPVDPEESKLVHANHGHPAGVEKATGREQLSPPDNIKIETQQPEIRKRKHGYRPATFAVITSSFILGVIATVIVFTKLLNFSPVQSQNAVLNRDITPSSLAAFDALGALRQYDRAEATFDALMTFSFDGVEFEHPAYFSIPPVPLRWSGTAFNGRLDTYETGANITCTVNGTVSADGAKLVSMEYSRLIQNADRGYLFQVSIQNLPLTGIIGGVRDGVGSFEKAGSGLQNNITKIEYVDGPLSNGQISPASIYLSTNWNDISLKPALKLTFGKATTLKAQETTTSSQMMR